MRNLYFGLISLLLYSCTFPKGNTNENDEMKNNIHGEYDSEIPEKEDAAAVITIDTIKKHHLGRIRTGDPVDKVIAELKSKYKVEYDSIPQSEEDTLYFYHYSVYDRDNELLFRIHPGDPIDGKTVINTIEVCSNRYITDKGLRIGDRVYHLKRKYTLKDAEFNYDDGLWVYAAEFPGCFFIDINADGIDGFNYEKPWIDEIPEHLKIIGIVIY